MATELTPKEYRMLAAVIQEMGEIPPIDFNNIAISTGQKYGKNARTAFKKVWEKLKAHKGDEGALAAGGGGKDAEAVAPKPKSRATTLKKSVGQRKAPVTGSARKTQRKSKKEAQAEVKAEAMIKAETEAENDADGETDATGIDDNDGDLDGNLESDDGAHASHTSSPGSYKEVEDEDEEGAALLGISVEEFRSMANGSLNHDSYVKTPRAHPDTDEEV